MGRAMKVLRLAAVGVSLVLSGAALAAPPPPAAPYYSVHVATVDTRAKAMAELATLGDQPYARAERRTSGYHIRFGAWSSKGPATEALAKVRGAHKDARVIQVEHPVAWLVAGEAAPSAPAPAPV